MAQPNEQLGVTDIKEVFMTFGTHRIQGFPLGTTFWSPVKANPESVFATEGIDGLTSFVKNSGGGLVMATITLMREAESNGILWAAHEVQKRAPGLTQKPFVFSHKTTKFASGRAVISTAPAGVEVSSSSTTLTWVFAIANFEGVLTGLSFE